MLVGSERWLDVAERIARSDDPKLVAHVLFAEARKFGFTASAFGVIAPILGVQGGAFFFSNWPDGWARYYIERGFVSGDPTVQGAKQRIAPFTTNEHVAQAGVSPIGRELLEECRSHRWLDALVIPMHGHGGHLAVAVFAGEEATIDPAARTTLQSLAYVSHQQVGNLSNRMPPPASLTPRERDCLRWVAAGKTDWDIGCLLGISQATAHFHIENAKRKLNCSTRAQAAALVASLL